MPLDFRNTNTLWASIVVETLSRLGLTTAIICPGSRSGPLAVAFAQHPAIEAIPILDERSAAFFGLGLAQRTGRPPALVCTSGTAAANFHPAIIEAHHSCVPLLVLTADRPPELRHCHAGQAIDQVKLYGLAPNWQGELALPSLELPLLAYVRQTVCYAWERSQWPSSGPVHLNLPFRDPLAPVEEPQALALAAHLNPEPFFAAVQPQPQPTPHPSHCALMPLLEQWQQTDRGVIIAGPAHPQNPEQYCRAIAQLSQGLQWPVLAEGLSPIRNWADLNPNVVSAYDLLLRNPVLGNRLAPERVIRIGPLPTSKVLRAWLEQYPSHQWIVDPSDHNLDPLHGNTTHLRCDLETMAQTLAQHSSSPADSPCPPNPYLQEWLTADQRLRHRVDTTLAELAALVEPKVSWLLSQTLPTGTPLFIASSMPVRDVESFWQPGASRVQPYFNRGANGIDGTLSTAMGVAHHQPSTVLLTGDLALLHDTNGFLIHPQWQGHLTILLINNHGGGIFGMLPIAQFEPPFETYFATPQTVNFGQLCAGYGVDHKQIHSWGQLVQALNPLPQQGIRVLEVVCDRQADAQWRHQHLPQFSHLLTQNLINS